jgi:selenocysteine-specific elongation factor
MIIGTAGHIDHGKSTLAAALTGRPMDRLAEERRRGITIELGFAPLDLGSDEPAGLVDVPGHEDFVRTMVAGASGVDLLLLVVDAQEGIRPQTLEHLDVAEQLGVAAGIPVITKADLADAEWIELVRADLHQRLATSTIRFEPPIVVSAITGAGIPELKARLTAVARSLRPPPDAGAHDLLRLPIDRVFALPGAGTVVTGTLWSGTVQPGDTVRIEPGARTARVRSVESFGRAVARAVPRSRTALSLQGVDHHELRRGQVVVAPKPYWPPSDAFDGVLTLLAGATRPLVARTRIRLHHGTAEVMARVYPKTAIPPGGSGPARVVLESPLLLRGGDRVVLRSYSPVTTIGGGWVADPQPPRRSGQDKAALWDPEPRTRLVALVARRDHGVPLDQLAVLLGAAPRDAAAWVREEPELVELEGRVVTAARVDTACGELLATVNQFHAAEPSRPGISLETLRNSMGRWAWLAEGVIQRLVADGKLTVRDGIAAVPGFEARSAGGEAEVKRVVDAVAGGGLTPPTVAELTSALGLRDAIGALRIAAARGLIQPVAPDRYYSAEALAGFTRTLREVGKDHGVILPAALKARTGLSRKYLIPLLEWCDRTGLTYRDPAGQRRLVNP